MQKNGENTILKIDSVTDLWHSLERCEDRGIYTYDEMRQQFIYSSYKSITVDASHIAHRLSDRGIVKGTPVLFSARTNPEFPACWLALMAIGAVPVPLPPREAMMGKYSHSERLSVILPYYNHFIGNTDDFRSIRDLTHENLNLIDFSELASEICQSVLFHPTNADSKDDIAFIQYTSGSTSHPKGIMVSYSNLFSNINAIADRLGVNPDKDSFASWLPMYHDMGLISQFLLCLFTQTSLTLVSPRQFIRRPIHFLETIERFSSAFCLMPNFALEWILRKIPSRIPMDLDLSSLRWLGVGAEPINHETLRKFNETMSGYGLDKKAISPCYGLAEATLAVTITPPRTSFSSVDIDGMTVVSCGSVVPDTQIKIEHFDNRDIGVIKVRGASVVKHALINGKVQSLMDEEGYYDTKDIGKVLDNDLFVLGRSDEMFTINGENVFPYDLEAAVRNLKASSRNRAACFAYQGKASEKEIIMLIELSTRDTVEMQSLNKQIKDSIAIRTGHILDKVIFVPPKSIPVTPSGKIQRSKAKSLYSSGFYTTARIKEDNNEISSHL